MSLNLYIDGAQQSRRRPAPLAISLVIHGAAFAALLSTPEIKLPEPSKSAWKQAIEGKEDKLVWFRFNKELPDVTPPKTKAERRPLRAQVKARQEIVASRKDAPKQKQLVWTDAPALPDTPPLELPNVLAVRMPRMTRAFEAPPESPAPEARKIEVPTDAPQLTPQPVDPVKLAEAPRIARPFVAPPTRVPVKIAEVAPVPEAPQFEARVDAPALDYTFKPPTRPFTAPPAKMPGTAAHPANPDAPPSVVAGDALTTPSDLLAANSRDLNLAVVGLNPANKPAALPTNSSPGQFSAGPKIRLEGADSAGEGKGVNVPDLFVRGAKDARPDLIAQAYAAPTASSTLHAAARFGGPRIGDPPEAPPEKQSGAVKVSSAPDRRFDGRDVYMMAIQMPNLTSYSGSWLMWYADRTAREVGLAPVAPPVAHRKVDPKYIASAAADHVEGKIQLACVIGRDGHVSTVELVRGLDARLDRSAEEALAKWEFTPATRHGEPIEVDVLVEIPFHLAPRVPVPY
jgi:TonB family protein